MNSRTRKHIWPMSLVMSIAIIGALAAFLVLTSNPGVTGAHGGDQDPHCSTVPAEQVAHNVAAEFVGTTNADGSAHTCANPGGATSPGTGTGTGTAPARHRRHRYHDARCRRHDYIRQHQWRRRSRTQGGD